MLQRFVKAFQSPEKEYYPAPFWFWNDDLNEENLLNQMAEMRDKGIYEFLIHARRGLSVPYLSEEWFGKVAFALAEAEKSGMRVWLYDEENWPSGYAGGRVIAENPDYCGKFVRRVKKGEAGQEGDVYLTGDESYDYYQGNCIYPPAYSDSVYVDMLSSESTRCFIKVTHEAYYKRFAKYFGPVVQGFFVDEPGFYNNFEMYNYCPDPATYTWTAAFPDYFKKAVGYDI